MRSSLGEPGTVQVSSDMPMEIAPAITFCAAAVTVSRSAPCFGQRAGDLVDEQRPRHAARLRQVGQRHVVVDDHHARP